MSDFVMYRTEVGMYVVRVGDDPVAWVCPAEDPNWWYGRHVDGGQVRNLCVPHDGTAEGEFEAAKRVAAKILRRT
ncbi:hypothetical protein [Actinomadura harenae]|uniref:Uncharacterized protein n=1 Tax=Actinomadura harenae TaxID=2483351 RepID=A0A3M2MDM4_9ACTN|nr:hypothetical protein [Actinomadura harenae]RMI47621.1 hypothetical protein EBO15_01585 [Actinomadura harenae]